MNTYKKTGGLQKADDRKGQSGMYQPSVPETVWGERDQCGRRHEGTFLEELGLELPPLVLIVRPTIEVTIYGALTLLRAL